MLGHYFPAPLGKRAQYFVPFIDPFESTRLRSYHHYECVLGTNDIGTLAENCRGFPSSNNVEYQSPMHTE